MSDMETAEKLVEAKTLTRMFQIDGREIYALKEADLIINKGEMLGIIGSSGAGKSTLLQLLGALDRPTSGQVLYEGQNIFKLNERKLALFRSKQVGFVFQASNLLPEFDAQENVALAAMISGAVRYDAMEKAKELLGSMGLEERLNHRPGKLSGGEQQRVAIARALINEPTLVLADEPTGNLDSATGDEIMEILFRLNKLKGQTFAIVTHNMALAESMDRVVIIQDGRFVDEVDKNLG